MWDVCLINVQSMSVKRNKQHHLFNDKPAGDASQISVPSIPEKNNR